MYNNLYSAILVTSWCHDAIRYAGVDADVIIYVTNRAPNTDCQGTLASAGHCLQDAALNRPLAGNVQLCEYSRETFRGDLETVVHELLHVLVCLLPC